MYVAFLDESGFTTDWKKGIEEQPFYVLATVLFKVDDLPRIYGDIRRDFKGFKIPAQGRPLGLGFEVKASDIARGTGRWGKNNRQRNQVRDLLLSAPEEYGGVAIVVVIDKQAHIDTYPSPDNPYGLAVKFTFERLQKFLERKEDYALCIYDQNTLYEDDIKVQHAELVTGGSRIKYVSDYYSQVVVYTHDLDRVIELSMGFSENSLGLQVADFFATMTYQYYKGGKPGECGWWDLLYESLDRRGGRVLGIGLKEFP